MRCFVQIISHPEAWFVITVFGRPIDGTDTVEDNNIIEIRPGVLEEAEPEPVDG